MSGKRIAVLVSGGGTNLQALIDARQRGELGGGEITAVISSKEGAYALERAQKAGIPGYVLPRKDFDSNRAMTLALVVLFVFVFSSMVVSTVEDLPYLDSAFEVASAMGTVGLTTGITPTLTPFSQGLLILLMYMGRVGILSFSIAFITGNRHPAKIKYPEMNVMIG